MAPLAFAAGESCGHPSHDDAGNPTDPSAAAIDSRTPRCARTDESGSVRTTYESMLNRDPISQITFLRHFTDTRNLPLIRRLGGLYSRAKLKEIGATDVFFGGNQWSLDADEMFGLDGYVHLCFRGNHPMEHIATVEGRIQQSVFLYVEASILWEGGVLYTPGVSNKSGMPTFTIEEARQMIDYEVLYTRTDWADPAIQARLQAAEKAEILVPDYVPMKYLEKHFPNG